MTSPDPGGRRRRRRRFRLHGSTLKRWLVLGFDRASRVLPDAALVAAVRGLVGLLRWSWPLPRHPLRIACQDVAVLAQRAGHGHRPREIYDRLLDQLLSMALAFLALRREGRSAAKRGTQLPASAVQQLEALLSRHGGAVIAVSHNVGAVYSAIGLDEAVPTLLVAKGQKDPEREALARDFFQRIGVDALLVRDMQGVTVARRCMRALRDGRALVATLDLLYRKSNRLSLRMFGETVTLAPWAFRFAAKLSVPVVPCYVMLEDGVVQLAWGEPLVDASVERLAEHYAHFLETWILRDPGSWAFLGDKRWRAVLHAAATRRTAPGGKPAAPAGAERLGA